MQIDNLYKRFFNNKMIGFSDVFNPQHCTHTLASVKTFPRTLVLQPCTYCIMINNIMSISHLAIDI